MRKESALSRLSAPSWHLAASITWAGSKHTFYIIRFLVDRSRVPDAYRTYAYFRWVDDQLDLGLSGQDERITFVERQEALMEQLYRGETPRDLTAEEGMLAELVFSDRETHSGLQTYIRNMMAVMVFDACRRGCLISQKELNDYSRWLAIAVTEAMHYFIGHDNASPVDERRYLAVTAAHIVHMLRDAREDTPAGYVNIPREFLQSHGIDANDLDSVPYRTWVRSRVELARACFKSGVGYLVQVENTRCRLAGYAYTARFIAILDDIERDGCRLPSGYSERKHPGAALRMSWSMLGMALNALRPGLSPRTLPET